MDDEAVSAKLVYRNGIIKDIQCKTSSSNLLQSLSEVQSECNNILTELVLKEKGFGESKNSKVDVAEEEGSDNSSDETIEPDLKRLKS